MVFDLREKRVWVAGQHGMVGGAMMRRLEREPCALLRDPGRAGIDLRRQAQVEDWMASQRPQIVFLTAGRVGGLRANDTFPADFLYDNLLIEGNIIHAAYRTGVEKLLFFGSSCIYPREAPQPIPEDALLMGRLEPTNEAYAVAKIAGIKLCQAYQSTDAISSRRCRPIFTGRATIFIPRLATFRRRCCAAFTKRKWQA
jgi:GDP-L-fucose synthase